MLLACIPWSASFAAADTTDPVDVRSGESITVGNINVANNDYAAQVRAESPEGNMDASLKAASVSLKNGEGNGTALIAESYIGLASADITGDITANAQNTGQVDGVSSSRSNIKVGGNVTTEIAGQDTWTNSVIAWGGNITVGKDVIAKGFHAGAINVYDESDEPSEKTTIIVNGGVSAQGEDVKGLNVWGGLSDITIKKSVTATSTDNSDYYWARGIDLAGNHDTLGTVLITLALDLFELRLQVRSKTDDIDSRQNRTDSAFGLSCTAYFRYTILFRRLTNFFGDKSAGHSSTAA